MMIVCCCLDPVLTLYFAFADWPLSITSIYTECQFPIPYEKSTCYVMEGALTVHFPPDYSVFTYVQGTQFSTLNTIRDGMSYGHLSKTHPSILGLKLMDSSYSLPPLVTPELQEAIVDQREQRNANIAVAVLVPLFILCCCGCCIFLWKRRPDDVDNLHAMLDDMFLPFVKSKTRSETTNNDSLYYPEKHPSSSNYHRYSNQRRQQGGPVNSSRRSGSHSASADAYLEEYGDPTTSDDEGLDTSARRRAKAREDKKKKKKEKKKKSKSKKKKSKHRSRDVNFDSTDTDNTDTDTAERGGTSSSSTDDNNSTTSSGSRSSRSSTTSSDRGSTTDGTSTSDDEKETTSTSTSDDDKETTSTSTSDDDKSSSSGDSEEEDDFDVNSMASSRSNFMLQRRNLRRRSKGRKLGPTTHSKPKSNLVITGGVPGEDDSSVMTGMTGATGTHSMASAATAQAKNVMAGARRGPMSGGGDDASVMTGIMSAATNRVANTKPFTGGGGGVGAGVGGVAAAGIFDEAIDEAIDDDDDDDDDDDVDDENDKELAEGEMTNIGTSVEMEQAPPSPPANSFSYIPKSSIGGGEKRFDD